MAAGGVIVLLATGIVRTYPGPAGPHPAVSPSPSPSHAAGNTFHQIYLPDLLVIEPAGLSARQLKKLRQISGVRSMVSADGAAIKIGNGKKPVNVLGVSPEQFRSWTPLATASDQRLWTALERGHFVTSDTLAKQRHLHPGTQYRLGSTGQQDLILGGSAPLGVSGIGALVNSKSSAGLGLIPGVLALISAPGDSMASLKTVVRHVAGKAATLISLRSQQQQQFSPNPKVSGSRPTSYLQLFQQSAARYCPGMSWTVLAAIGQIESGDGSNPGLSSAGALGPMQFMPSTWAAYGRGDVHDPHAAIRGATSTPCCAMRAGSGGPRRRCSSTTRGG